MAAANVNVVEAILNEGVNLDVVKQLIAEQEPNYKLRNCDKPLYHWKIPNVLTKHNKSNPFAIGEELYTCETTLNISQESGAWILTLAMLRMEDYALKPEEDKFHSFQHFVCHFEYSDCKEKIRHSYALSKNAFLSSARKNEILFNLEFLNKPVSDVTVDIFVELSTSSKYASPSDNAVVGKIEKFEEKRRLVFENRMMVVSPRFKFGSPGQRMVVYFWRRDESEGNDQQSLMITLYVINDKKPEFGPLFPLDVTVTIFSQKDGGSDFVERHVLLTEKLRCEYPVLSASNKDLHDRRCLENDTLYYRVVVKPKDRSDFSC